MSQYINKSAVVAEIEKLESRFQNGSDEDYADGYHYSLKLVKRILDTIEVKEVDIEKQVIDWWNAHYSSKAYTFEGYAGHYVENSTLIEIAKHFFELGLKAQKGK